MIPSWWFSWPELLLRITRNLDIRKELSIYELYSTIKIIMITENHIKKYLEMQYPKQHGIICITRKDKEIGEYLDRNGRIAELGWSHMMKKQKYLICALRCLVGTEL